MEGDLMRKFLMLVAIVGLATLVAVPAMALDFKFGAEYRVRFYDGVNIGFDKTASNTATYFNTQVGPNARGVQIRIRPRFDVSDDNGNMTATLRLEIGDIEWGGGGGAFNNTNFGNPIGASTARVGNGAGGGGGDDGVNVETKWAYVDFASPWGIPLRWRAGLQPLYLPKGILIDDDGAGLRAYGNAGIVSYDAWWWRLASGKQTNPQFNPSAPSGTVPCVTAGALTFATPTACTAGGGTVINNQAPINPGTTITVDNNYDVYGAKLDFAIAKPFNAGVYYLYVDNRINCVTTDLNVSGVVPNNCGASARVRTSNYVGLTFTGDLGFMKYDVDAIWGSALGGPSGAYGGAASPIRVEGWTLDAHVGIPIGPVTINPAITYGTGDHRDGGKSEAFPGGLAPSWNGPGGGYELLGSGGPFDAVEFTQDGTTNLLAFGLWLEYRPVKALWLKAAYAYAMFDKSQGNCAGAAANTCYGPSYGSPTASQQGPAGKSALGQEISLRADYDLWTNFKVQGQLGWFIPSRGDTAGEYVLQLLYNF
jgi:hypothetical protein